MLLTTLFILIGLLALAVPVAAALGVLGLSLSALYSKLPLSIAIGEVAWGTSNNFLLVAIPFFVLLGEILLRSGMAERMYSALVLWIPWLPGGLMHSNIAACAMFAATSGSSVATAATIGTVALNEVEKHGYSERLFLGTIAAGGTLGILIPPSINMIVYGVLTDTSIPKLYLAGFIPGLVLASLFSLTVLLLCLFRPALGGRRTSATWEQRIKALPDLLPPIIIFLAVIGSIYAGWATATESAALGVIAAVGIAAWNRRLTMRALLNAFEGTMRTTAMIMAILIAAYFLNFVIGSIGLTAQVNRLVTGLGLTSTELLLGVIVFYLALGCFMETLSMMVATVPIIAPIMVKAGYDPIWFGVLFCMNMQVSYLSPPFGPAAFYLKGVAPPDISLGEIFSALWPFIGLQVLSLAIVLFVPEIALWLPGLN